jgi:hypothetical protein
MKLINYIELGKKEDKENRDLADKINNLIKGSFGVECSGDNTIYTVADDILPICYKFKKGKLGLIVKVEDRHGIRGILKNLTSFPMSVCGSFVEDKKGQEDGSVISVLPKYEHEARKYAELYEKKFDKEVTINIVNSFNGCEYFN